MTRRPPSGTVSEADDRPNIVTRDSDLGRRPSARSLRGLDRVRRVLISGHMESPSRAAVPESPPSRTHIALSTQQVWSRY